MRSFFPLFYSHIDLAHHYWAQVIQKGDTVIDATCGNGKDTLVLAKLALEETKGHVIGLDIQKEALLATEELLRNHLPTTWIRRITLLEQSHTVFPLDGQNDPIRLVVYNLGYRPLGAKRLTTMTATTLISVEKALQLLMPGGVVSITCYPGHEEGGREELALETWLNSLNPQIFNICQHRWLNRHLSPSLILIQKLSNPVGHAADN
ncbi:MAG: class I SAM-dependent methyltransferase [Simkania sp.]|nr:class I SAM-dependent methyltransferase [Simkania sp.]